MHKKMANLERYCRSTYVLLGNEATDDQGHGSRRRRQACMPAPRGAQLCSKRQQRPEWSGKLPN